jgi:hypothetical protein
MKPRLLALLVLFFLSWNAFAQTRCQDSRARRPAPAAAHKYGAYERTKLLMKGRGSDAARQLGAVDRRTLLTSGKSIYPKPTRHGGIRPRRR